jgi:hypothetical protein
LLPGVRQASDEEFKELNAETTLVSSGISLAPSPASAQSSVKEEETMARASRVPLAAGELASQSLATRAVILETLTRSSLNVPQRTLVAKHHANSVSALIIRGLGQVSDFSLVERRVTVLVEGIALHVRLPALHPDAAALVGAAIERRLHEVAA